MADLINVFFSKAFWFFNGWDLMQVILSIVGFYFAYRQLRKTRNSIEAAEQAAKSTRHAIQERLLFIDSNEIVNGINLLKENIISKNFPKAIWRLDDLLNRITQFKERSEYIDTDEKKSRIGIMQDYFINLEILLRENSNKSENIDVTTIYTKISRMGREIYGWIETSKYNEE